MVSGCWGERHSVLAMKIAVTGCNGSVGKRVVLCALESGFDVVGIDYITPHDRHQAWDSGRFAYHEADLTVFEHALQIMKSCDAVIHLAGKYLYFNSGRPFMN
jgi:nucleoside-diphosphate-sugar epimerase